MKDKHIFMKDKHIFISRILKIPLTQDSFAFLS